jgi:hypothetical protein
MTFMLRTLRTIVTTIKYAIGSQAKPREEEFCLVRAYGKWSRVSILQYFVLLSIFILRCSFTVDEFPFPAGIIFHLRISHPTDKKAWTRILYSCRLFFGRQRSAVSGELAVANCILNLGIRQRKHDETKKL